MRKNDNRESDSNYSNVDGQTWLHILAYYGCAEIMEMHVTKGEDVNKKDKYGMTPMHYAAANGHLTVVKVLFNEGANPNPNIKANNGTTPMHYAAQNGHLPVVKFLFNKGANPYIKDNDGDTAIDLAKYWKRRRIVQYLKKNVPLRHCNKL